MGKFLVYPVSTAQVKLPLAEFLPPRYHWISNNCIFNYFPGRCVFSQFSVLQLPGWNIVFLLMLLSTKVSGQLWRGEFRIWVSSIIYSATVICSVMLGIVSIKDLLASDWLKDSCLSDEIRAHLKPINDSSLFYWKVGGSGRSRVASYLLRERFLEKRVVDSPLGASRESSCRARLRQ